MDVSAEIRSARKKSRDKMKAFPDDDLIEDPDEEDGGLTLEQPVDPSRTLRDSFDTQTPEGRLFVWV